MKRLISCLIIALVLGGWTHGKSVVSGGQSQGQSSFISFGGDFPLLNLVKTGSTWTQSGGAVLSVTAIASMDINGYPTNLNSQAAGTSFHAPSTTQYPGHQVVTWAGAGEIHAFVATGGSTVTNVSCTGVTTAGAGFCDNTGCSTFTGSISGTTLTVTIASTGTGCSLVVGQPFSPAQNNAYGTPTIITGASGSANCGSCTGSGGTGTYLINFGQTVASTSFYPGGRFEMSMSGGTSSGWIWDLFIDTISSPNYVQNLAFYNINDESTYWGGEIFGTLYKARLKQGGFGVWRNLDWSNQAISTGGAACAQWSTRMGTGHYSYGGVELRSSLYVGQLTYSSNAYSVTIPSTYVSNSGNAYTSAPVDKQIVIATIANTSGGAATLNINGTGAVPIYNGLNTVTPAATEVASFIYDAQLNEWLIDGGTAGVNRGVDCGTPVEVFFQLCIEIGMHPWFMIPVMAVDPMTDWTKQLASYVKSNSPAWMVPRYEGPDEPWNTVVAFVGCYLSAKSFANWGVTQGKHCGSTGDILNEQGKFMSTIGQDVASVYGGFSTTAYKVIAGVQTGNGNASGGPHSNGNDTIMTSAAYVAQAAAPQAGYTKTAASGWITGIAVAPYWSPAGSFVPGEEISFAYNYLLSTSNVTAANWITYIGTSDPYTNPSNYWTNWLTWADGFGAGVFQMDGYEGGYNNGALASTINQSVTGGTNAGNAVLTVTGNNISVAGMGVALNSVVNGGGGTWFNNQNDTVTFSSGNPSLAASNNLSAGMSFVFGAGTSPASPFKADGTPYCVIATGLSSTNFELSATCGGGAITPTGNGSALGTEGYFVVSATTNTITISLDSTSLGSLTSATLFYNASIAYVSALRLASYNQVQAATLNKTIYNDFIAGGGEFPSMFVLAGTGTWSVWNPDIYGATQSSVDPGTPQWQAIQQFNGIGSCGC